MHPQMIISLAEEKAKERTTERRRSGGGYVSGTRPRSRWLRAARNARARIR
jgi:hypothetical protein